MCFKQLLIETVLNKLKMSERITCQRNGCTVEYLESENNETSCQYHPGQPIFHEGLKG